MAEQTDGNIMRMEPKVENPIKVVDVKREGERLIVTIEGPDVESVTGPAARNMAYAERLKHGYHNAGLEAYGGPYPYDKLKEKDLATHEEILEASQNQKDLVYRAQFRLTPGI